MKLKGLALLSGVALMSLMTSCGYKEATRDQIVELVNKNAEKTLPEYKTVETINKITDYKLTGDEEVKTKVQELIDAGIKIAISQGNLPENFKLEKGATFSTVEEVSPEDLKEMQLSAEDVPNNTSITMKIDGENFMFSKFTLEQNGNNRNKSTEEIYYNGYNLPIRTINNMEFSGAISEGKNFGIIIGTNSTYNYKK